MKKQWMLFPLIALLCVYMIGCGKDFDAAGYVQGYMDTCLKGSGKQFAKLCAVDTSQTEALYRSGIEDVMHSWLSGVTLNAEAEDMVTDALQDLFMATRYNVTNTKKEKDGSFTVTVTIEPLIFPIDKGIMKEIETSATTQYTDDNPEDEEIDQEKYGLIVAKKFSSYVQKQLEKKAYGDTITLTTTLSIENKQYKLSDEEQGNLISNTLITSQKQK